MPDKAIYSCQGCKSVISLYTPDKNEPWPEYTGANYHKLRPNTRCNGVLKLVPEGVRAAFMVGGQEAVKAMYPASWYVSL